MYCSLHSYKHGTFLFLKLFLIFSVKYSIKKVIQSKKVLCLNKLKGLHFVSILENTQYILWGEIDLKLLNQH